jgi:hypothetical protein
LQTENQQHNGSNRKVKSCMQLREYEFESTNFIIGLGFGLDTLFFLKENPKNLEFKYLQYQASRPIQKNLSNDLNPFQKYLTILKIT